MLLDQFLLATGTGPHTVQGPQLNSHLEIALAVASGIADTALGLRATATDLGLDFIPLAWESYDVARPARHWAPRNP